MTEPVTKDEQMNVAASMQGSNSPFDRCLGDFLVKIGLGDAVKVKEGWPNTWARHNAFPIRTKPENTIKKLGELLNQQRKLIEQLGEMHYTEKDAEI